MSDDSSEKSYQATSRKLEKLKEEGQVLRSRDLMSGMIFMGCLIALAILADKIYQVIASTFNDSFAMISYIDYQPKYLIAIFKHYINAISTIILPLFFVVSIIIFLTTTLYGGWNFTLKSIEFKPDRINPFVNLPRLFGVQIFVNILKSAARFVIIFSLMVFFLYVNKSNILQLSAISKGYIGETIYNLIIHFLFIMSIGIVVIVTIDLLYNYYDFNKKSMMDAHEMKNEFKETDGNTEVKRKLKMIQINLIKSRLSAIIPKATVIVTNPTHYAVAIKYDRNKDAAPKVIAKGKDEIAAKIRELANINGIPIYQAPSLARSLYFTTKQGAQINPGLYVGVAIVFSYIYQLKQYQLGKAPFPEYVSDLKIPDELVYKET